MGGMLFIRAISLTGLPIFLTIDFLFDKLVEGHYYEN